MNEPAELHCTYDSDSNQWLVWFSHPLGGMNVLDTFDNETAALTFKQEQEDSADFGDQE